MDKYAKGFAFLVLHPAVTFIQIDVNEYPGFSDSINYTDSIPSKAFLFFYLGVVDLARFTWRYTKYKNYEFFY